MKSVFLYFPLILTALCVDGELITLQEEEENGLQEWPDFKSDTINVTPLRRRNPIDFRKVVLDAVTHLQTYMKYGNDTMEISPMEPYVFDQTAYDVITDEQIIKLNGQINGTILGLPDYKIGEVNAVFTALWANITLLFSELKASGHYTVNGLIADVITLEGAGQYEITWKNVTVNLQPQLNNNPNNVSLDHFKVRYSVEDSQLSMEGLMGQSSNIMKQFIQDAQKAILDRTLSWLETVLEQGAINYSARTIFKGDMTAVKFMEFLKNF